MPVKLTPNGPGLASNPAGNAGVGAFATSTMAFVFAGLLPLVAADNHVTISEAGRLVMAYSLAYAIGTPILATLTGAVDRKRVVVGALVLFVAGNIIAATSNSFLVLTSAQIVMGMAAGLFAATAQATAVMPSESSCDSP